MCIAIVLQLYFRMSVVFMRENVCQTLNLNLKIENLLKVAVCLQNNNHYLCTRYTYTRYMYPVCSDRDHVTAVVRLLNNYTTR